MILFFVLFLLSIKFRLIWFSSIKKIYESNKITKPAENPKFGNEIFDVKDNVQETFSFDKKNEEKDNQKKIFILPKLDLLEQPKEKYKKNNLRSDINEEFLEKILLDFGVEGKIRKISSGPVVTLNEFEPAAGVKVSKIINLSDDIAFLDQVRWGLSCQI